MTYRPSLFIICFEKSFDVEPNNIVFLKLYIATFLEGIE